MARWKKPRWQAGIAVAIAVVFSAIVLWPETRAAHRLNDLPAGIAWVRWAADRIATGQSPLDGWLPQLGLGSAHFHQYQVLPHIVAGFLATLSDPETVVRWSMYLLIVTWPISVYLGARLLDQRRRVAAIAALLSPLLLGPAPGFGLEWSSYLFRGNGLWTQAFGMWLIPLSIGFTWRAIERGRGYAPAALLLAATLCCHLFWGYVGVIALGVIVLVGAGKFVRRVGRGVVVGVGGLLASAWLVVPLVTDLRYVGQSQLNPLEFNSYGARRALEWLIKGMLLDDNRPKMPTLTILAFVGAAVAVVRFRRDAATRVILVFTIVSFVLFFGRPTLGPVIDWIPWLDELPMHRFIGPFQLGALLLAGIGGSWAIGYGLDLVRRAGSVRIASVATAIAAVSVVILLPGAADRVRFEDDSAMLIDAQRTKQADDGIAFAKLVALATRRGGGRIFAGDVTSGNFVVGLIPAYAEILNDDGLGIGFVGRVASVSVTAEMGFNANRLDNYPLYGVRYVILPSVGEPRVPSRLVRTEGVFSLYEINDGGYLRTADSVGPAIVADRADLARQIFPYVASNLAAQGITRPIAFEGASAAQPTLAARDITGTAPGMVLQETDHPDGGEFRGRVTMDRRALVVLAESFHGRWVATVDGKPVKTQMVAPSFVATAVPVGTHDVAFRYVPYPTINYALLFSMGILAIGSLVVVDRRARRRVERAP